MVAMLAEGGGSPPWPTRDIVKMDESPSLAAVRMDAEEDLIPKFSKIV